MSRSPIERSKLKAWLVHHSEWREEDQTLVRVFAFESFSRAISFMKELSKDIDEMDHHPNWSNVYNRIDVTLSTHDVGAITELDLRLAELMSEKFAEMA